MTMSSTKAPEAGAPADTDVVCQYVEEFADGKCEDPAAEIVEVGNVDVALCPDHEEQTRAENEHVEDA